MFVHRTQIAIGSLVMVLAVGCAPEERDRQAVAGEEQAAGEAVPRLTSAAVPAPSLTDAEIAAIVVTANAVDADLGDVAAARATNPSIRSFGETMARDHRSVNEQAGALVAKLGVTPAENDVSRKLRTDGDAFRAELEGKTGAAFDQAYIAHEVTYHQAVIDAVDQLLIPNARNEELKQTLISVRPVLLGHLRHAEQLQAATK